MRGVWTDSRLPRLGASRSKTATFLLLVSRSGRASTQAEGGITGKGRVARVESGEDPRILVVPEGSSEHLSTVSP